MYSCFYVGLRKATNGRPRPRFLRCRDDGHFLHFCVKNESGNLSTSISGDLHQPAFLTLIRGRASSTCLCDCVTMGIEPPFIYSSPSQYSFNGPTHRGFNPKAATQASWTPAAPKVKKDGPLVEVNRHPDSVRVSAQTSSHLLMASSTS